MPEVADRSFGLNLRAMKLFGFYPPEHHKLSYRIRTYLLYFLLIVPVPILQCLYLYMQKDLSFKEVADTTFLIAEVGCYVPKFWPFLNNGERIKRCIHYFDREVFHVTRNEHLEIVDEGVKVCRATTAIFLACVSSGFVSWSSRPIAWEGHMFPTNVWLPFDAPTAPWYYNVFVYVYLVLAVGYGAYSCAAVESLIAGLAYQATIQIKILKNNLQFLGEQADEEVGPDEESVRSQLLQEKVKRCVVHHNLILDFVKEYERCFSQMAFSQFSGGIVIFCVSCLQLTIMDVLSFNFLAMLMFLIAMVAEVYLYCHFGTVLFEENASINTAVYLSRWYEFDVGTRRMLVLLMERAKRPMTISVGKIFDMSLVTFTMILRRSYSLLAVLENIEFA